LRELVRQPLGAVDDPDRFDEGAAIYGDGPVLGVAVGEVADETVDIAVEDEADDLGVGVDDG